MNESNKTKWIHVRLSKEDYHTIHKKFEASIHRKLSDYIRRVLLQKPVVIASRNVSLDDFMSGMITLRKELSAIGNNLNQVVRQVHILGANPEVLLWLPAVEKAQLALLQKAEQINYKIAKINDIWLL